MPGKMSRPTRVWYFPLIYFCLQIAVYGVTFSLPTQVTAITGQKLGFAASLVTAIPWVFALLPRAASTFFGPWPSSLALSSGVDRLYQGLPLIVGQPRRLLGLVGQVEVRPDADRNCQEAFDHEHPLNAASRKTPFRSSRLPESGLPRMPESAIPM
jgi:hypothetical protein